MKMVKQKKVLVIGGGAAGLTAAIAAARGGAKVTILEALDRVGKKILATGNGRCNYTNIHMDLKYFHGTNVKFARGVLGAFDVQQTIDFFEYLGVAHRIEDGGKVFPMSGQAASVLDVLRYELQNLGVKEYCNAEVMDIRSRKNEFEVHLKNGEKIKGDKVIVTTGGKASPQLGSKGGGYGLAEKLGHAVIMPFPALVQLDLKASFLKGVKGVKFIGTAEVLKGDQVLRKEEGEILFTDYGISGPPILQLSRKAAEQLTKKQKVYIKIDMFPNLSEEELLTMLYIRLGYQPEKQLDFSFIGLINKRLIPVILKEAGMKNLQKQCSQATEEELKAIIKILKAWKVEIIGTQPWKNAQTTAGGIDVKDIDTKTMESKIVPGLYFAGEIIDIDGDCGGFNLQWAWSSGYIAGENAVLNSYIEGDA
ncbi:MAG: NAD(P)/FAD-dependent oxidoreductase [Clostridiaceae bacterium]|nr:NAD(P)/FAD-dependent oxidoreductase [Clostridiaceae bacterium]